MNAADQPRPEASDWTQAIAIAIGVTSLWLLVHVALGTSPTDDNQEQILWAQEMAWGYPKHPPAPTWLLGLLSWFAPISPRLTYVATLVCQVATFVCLWRLVFAAAGRYGALVALVLLTCIQYFNVRANYFNHNTAMIAACAVCALFVYRALREQRLIDWIVVGASAALALLSKYQALPLLAGIGVYLTFAGYLADPRVRRGVTVAVVVASVLLAPHVVWLIRNDFAPLRYASHNVAAALDWTGRPRVALEFLAQLLWRSVGAIVCAMIALRAARNALPIVRDRLAAHLLLACAIAPSLAMGAMLAILGSRLQNHWAAQLLAFAAPCTVVVWPRLATESAWKRALAIAVAVHCVLLAYLITAVTVYGQR